MKDAGDDSIISTLKQAAAAFPDLVAIIPSGSMPFLLDTQC